MLNILKTLLACISSYFFLTKTRKKFSLPLFSVSPSCKSIYPTQCSWFIYFSLSVFRWIEWDALFNSGTHCEYVFWGNPFGMLPLRCATKTGLSSCDLAEEAEVPAELMQHVTQPVSHLFKWWISLMIHWFLEHTRVETWKSVHWSGRRDDLHVKPFQQCSLQGKKINCKTLMPFATGFFH